MGGAVPYIFVDEIPDECEEAQVVSKEEYDGLMEDFNNLSIQRDEAIERAEIAEEGWKKSREKYANAFLSTPSKMKDNDSAKIENLTAQSFDSLFKVGKE